MMTRSAPATARASAGLGWRCASDARPEPLGGRSCRRWRHVLHRSPRSKLHRWHTPARRGCPRARGPRRPSCAPGSGVGRHWEQAKGAGRGRPEADVGDRGRRAAAVDRALPRRGAVSVRRRRGATGRCRRRCGAGRGRRPRPADGCPRRWCRPPGWRPRAELAAEPGRWRCGRPWTRRPDPCRVTAQAGGSPELPRGAGTSIAPAAGRQP